MSEGNTSSSTTDVSTGSCPKGSRENVPSPDAADQSPALKRRRTKEAPLPSYQSDSESIPDPNQRTFLGNQAHHNLFLKLLCGDLLRSDYDLCVRCATLHPPLQPPTKHVETQLTRFCQGHYIDYLPRGPDNGYNFLLSHIATAFEQKAFDPQFAVSHLARKFQIQHGQVQYTLSTTADWIDGNLILRHDHQFGPFLEKTFLDDYLGTYPLRVCPHQSTTSESMTKRLFHPYEWHWPAFTSSGRRASGQSSEIQEDAWNNRAGKEADGNDVHALVRWPNRPDHLLMVKGVDLGLPHRARGGAGTTSEASSSPSLGGGVEEGGGGGGGEDDGSDDDVEDNTIHGGGHDTWYTTSAIVLVIVSLPVLARAGGGIVPSERTTFATAFSQRSQPHQNVKEKGRGRTGAVAPEEAVAAAPPGPSRPRGGDGGRLVVIGRRRGRWLHGGGMGLSAGPSPLVGLVTGITGEGRERGEIVPLVSDLGPIAVACSPFGGIGPTGGGTVLGET
ncbi:hypothetical protein PG997_008797 [Apiospora hydei]|uniref:Uncharacterized protein n=1 Tax=Apiospora hydei TaxID=1337664 RepID=A0ABR1WBU2_9PEZI